MLEANVKMLPLVVLDANSAFFLSHIEIDSTPMLIQLIGEMRVQISSIVWDECSKLLKEKDPIAIDIFKSLKECRNNENISDCSDFIKTVASKRHIPTHKHKGELSAAALTLWLSRTTREQIILVTDEFKILELLDDMIGEQCAGIVFTTFELILFLFARFPKLLRPNVEDLLKQLLLLFPKPKNKNKESKAKIEYITTCRKLKKICRYKECARRSCYEQ